MQRIMKKTIAILLSVSCLFGLNSCFKTEDDIFADSPAQRLNQLESNYREVLSSATDGWVLQYFASEEEQGYPFIVKFDNNGLAIIAGNNSVSTGNVYKEEASTYDFVQDMSVVLTFDTYNSILHEFSAPSTDGVGHGGDYEFQVQGVSENQDTVYLMGKKTYIPMRLVRFPKGSTYTDKTGKQSTINEWKDYFDAIKANTDRLFLAGIGGYTLTAAGETYDVDGLASGVMILCPHGIDEKEIATRSQYRGVIVNLDNSIYLSSPFTGENKKFSVRTLNMNSDNSMMASPDGTVQLNGPSIVSDLQSASVSWLINPESLSAKLKPLYDAAVAGAAARNRTLQIGYKFDSKTEKYCIVVNLLQKGSTKPSVALYYTEGSVAADGTFTYTADGSGDRNAAYYGQNVTGLLDLVKGLSGSYTVTAQTPFTPATLTFVDKADASNTFKADYNY